MGHRTPPPESTRQARRPAATRRVTSHCGQIAGTARFALERNELLLHAPYSDSPVAQGTVDPKMGRSRCPHFSHMHINQSASKSAPARTFSRLEAEVGRSGRSA